MSFTERKLTPVSAPVSLLYRRNPKRNRRWKQKRDHLRLCALTGELNRLSALLRKLKIGVNWAAAERTFPGCAPLLKAAGIPNAP